MKNTIRLDQVSHEGNSVFYRFSSSLKIFNKQEFFIEYKKTIPDPIASISSIPFAALMMPVAWASGADLEIPFLDQRYIQSLETVRSYWEKCYGGRWPFTSRLLTHPVTNMAFPVHRYGQLYGSGVDSLATYLHHRDLQPELFTVIGAEFSLSKNGLAAVRKQKLYDDFAESQGANVTMIYTDAGEVLNTEKLKRFSNNWYGGVQHGLMLSGMVAPASYPYLKTLFMAGCSHKQLDYDFPCGGEAEVVKNLRWASTHVIDDLNEINRAHKIKRFIKGRADLYPFIRVCWAHQDGLNCSKCEKCLRTICELFLNNIDPNRASFKVDSKTLIDLREMISNHFHLFFRGNEMLMDFWRSIQESIDLSALQDIHGSREFFEWFQGFDKMKIRQNKISRQMLSAVLNTRDALSHSSAALSRMIKDRAPQAIKTVSRS